MPTITIEAIHGDAEPRRWTLKERIVADNLASDHYAEYLIERLSWAIADAEAIESRPSDVDTDRQNAPRRVQLKTRPRGDRRPSPLGASTRVRP